MDGNDKQENRIEETLKEAYGEIEPADSWAALRDRIDERIKGAESGSASVVRTAGGAAFWRRTALALAACLLVTVGLLLYTLGFIQGSGATVQMAEGLFSQAQLMQLKDAFSNVRELFAEQSAWIMVGAGDDAEIGVDPMGPARDAGRVVVVRLAVNFEKENTAPRFFDVVTFPNQEADFQLPLAGSSAVRVFLRPRLKDNAIAVEIRARVNGRASAENTAAVDDEAFTSLVRLPSDGDWVTINGIAQSVSSI